MTATAMAVALCLFEEPCPQRGLAANVVTRQSDVPEQIVRHRAEPFAFAPAHHRGSQAVAESDGQPPEAEQT